MLSSCAANITSLLQCGASVHDWPADILALQETRLSLRSIDHASRIAKDHSRDLHPGAPRQCPQCPFLDVALRTSIHSWSHAVSILGDLQG